MRSGRSGSFPAFQPPDFIIRGLLRFVKPISGLSFINYNIVVSPILLYNIFKRSCKMPPVPADKLRPAEMRCSILSKYTGIPCSRCGHTFTDQDDVVVCPECGAPHHRSCFRELGHCALQEQHAPDFSWSYHSAQSESEGTSQTVICSRCGAATPAELPNCQMCGSPLSSDAQEPPSLSGQG